ncbi:potassium channel family protein [Desertibacillus haloalkaliphilus]|uniref:potassium channel family protein n=1 Tax=Desertibacillus haloalkaliphilus TaxID=1328930 RepID=UPI001C273BE8|nr:potassium channel family protein [Desertibacillus haloalkaliphilus]MBU8908853.1 potassium channel family protein [Desertibacillus haloalkaliphilus]
MGELIIFVVMVLAVIGVIMSLLLLLNNHPVRGRRVSLRNFIVLLLVYLTIIIAFGSLYMALEMMGFAVLTEGERRVGGYFIHLLEDVMYFSAVTLLSVGYGDITPLGIGRPIAMVQALIGYVLPAAFVVTTVIYNEKSSE